jgi:hypothetical protein
MHRLPSGNLDFQYVTFAVFSLFFLISHRFPAQLIMSINVFRVLQEYKRFRIPQDLLRVEEIAVGLINSTWKVSVFEKYNAVEEYIVQKINTNVFPFPDRIDENIRSLGIYVKQKHPESSFIELTPLSSESESTLLTLCSSDDVDTNTAGVYRVMKYIPHSYALAAVKSPSIAYEAAKEFAKFHKLLQDFPSEQLHITIPNFHNLSARYQAFQTALDDASKESTTRFLLAQPLIEQLESMKDILTKYEHITQSQLLPLRVIHHDTKISNILFHTETHQGKLSLSLNFQIASNIHVCYLTC